MDGFVWVRRTRRPQLPAAFHRHEWDTRHGLLRWGRSELLLLHGSNFATSDRWFHPVMSRTGPNREYIIAGTSQGRAYPNGTECERFFVADGKP